MKKFLGYMFVFAALCADPEVRIRYTDYIFFRCTHNLFTACESSDHDSEYEQLDCMHMAAMMCNSRISNDLKLIAEQCKQEGS